MRGTSAAEHEASLRKLYSVKTVQVSNGILLWQYFRYATCVKKNMLCIALLTADSGKLMKQFLPISDKLSIWRYFGKAYSTGRL